MKPAWATSVLWAVASVGVLQTTSDGLILVVVLFYTLLGCGLPAGVALTGLGPVAESAIPKWIVGLLGAIGASFASSALGGQPLAWTGEWTASRHVVASMIVGILLSFAAEQAVRAKAI